MSEDDVKEVWAWTPLRRGGTETMQELADRLVIGINAIKKIRTGRTWKHLNLESTKRG